jgi:hypothetical protein
VRSLGKAEGEAALSDEEFVSPDGKSEDDDKVKAGDAEELADGKVKGLPRGSKAPALEMTPEVKRMIDNEVEKRFMQNFETWKEDPSKNFTDVVRKNLKFTEEDEHEEADRKFKERHMKRIEMTIQRDEKRKADKEKQKKLKEQFQEFLELKAKEDEIKAKEDEKKARDDEQKAKDEEQQRQKRRWQEEKMQEDAKRLKEQHEEKTDESKS